MGFSTRMSTNTASGQTVKSPRRGKYDWLLLSIKLTGFNSPSGSKINIQLSKNQHFNYTSFGGRCIGYLSSKNGSSSRYCPCVFWMKTRRTRFYSKESKQQDSTMLPNTVSRLLHISLWKKSLCNRLDGCGKIYSSAVYPIRHNTPNGQRILYK